MPVGRKGRRTACTIFLAVALAAACEHDPVSVSSDVLVARAMTGVLELTNRSDATVHFFAAERNTLAVLDWIPCVDPAACQGIPPAAILRLPYAGITGYSPGAEEVVVYHWRLVPGTTPRTWRPDSIRSVTVTLRRTRW